MSAIEKRSSLLQMEQKKIKALVLDFSQVKWPLMENNILLGEITIKGNIDQSYKTFLPSK
jgi:hypothetical protein